MPMHRNVSVSKVEKASNIKLDAARDELGWVQEPRQPLDKQRYWTIECELTFQNALGMLRLGTTLSEPPKELTLHLRSPVERLFHSSRRAPNVRTPPVSDSMELGFRPQRPLESSAISVVSLASSRSAQEAIRAPSMLPTGTHMTNIPEDITIGPESLSGGEIRPVTIDLTDSPGGSHADEPELCSAGGEDQEREDPGYARGGSPAPKDYPTTSGEIELNMDKLLSALTRDDIQAGEQQEGETDEEYQLRVAEENEMLAEIENQRFLDTASYVAPQLADIFTTDFRSGWRARSASSLMTIVGDLPAPFSIIPRSRRSRRPASRSRGSREGSCHARHTAWSGPCSYTTPPPTHVSTVMQWGLGKRQSRSRPITSTHHQPDVR
jgi:hypothetical protein